MRIQWVGVQPLPKGSAERKPPASPHTCLPLRLAQSSYLSSEKERELFYWNHQESAGVQSDWDSDVQDWILLSFRLTSFMVCVGVVFPHTHTQQPQRSEEATGFCSSWRYELLGTIWGYREPNSGSLLLSHLSSPWAKLCLVNNV